MQPGKYIHSCLTNFMVEFRLEQIFIAQARNPSWWGNKTSSNTTTDKGQSSGPAVMLWGSWDQRWAQQAADSQDSNTSQPVLGSSARLYKALPDPLSHVPCPVLVPHIQLFQLPSLLPCNHLSRLSCPSRMGMNGEHWLKPNSLLGIKSGDSLHLAVTEQFISDWRVRTW